MNNKGHLYLIMGTAGSGKGTLRKNLVQDSEIDLFFLKSYVSRPMREGEVDGDIYHFITEEKFKKMIIENKFLEYEIVHKTAYYGTKHSDVVENGIDRGIKVCKEIDIEGLKNIQTNNPQLKENITSIFLSLSPEKLHDRIEARGAHMSEEEFRNRELSLVKEVREAKEYCDYIIDTSEKTPEEVLEEVKKVLK